MSDKSDKKDKAAQPSLSESDVETKRGLNRRTMLRGFGAGTLGLSAVGLSGCVTTGVTDADSGSYADPAGMGRGAPVRRTTSGITDSDGGAYADPAGNGRGVTRRVSAGVTDSDAGPFADPAGRGRGATGMTDSDGGTYADPVGRGRRGY